MNLSCDFYSSKVMSGKLNEILNLQVTISLVFSIGEVVTLVARVLYRFSWPLIKCFLIDGV